jgi:hypothetical protein
VAYYEDEILHELNLGEKYTAKQLKIFVVENKNTTVISKTCNHFVEYSTRMHTVLEIIEGFEHKGEHQSTYHVPSSKTKIYIVD